MNQKQRDAMRDRIVQIIESCGPAGINFVDLYPIIALEFRATRRNVQDQIIRAEQAGDVAIVGLGQGGARCTYKHTRYKAGMSQQESDRADIYRFRHMKTLFPGPKPGRFDVR